MNLEEINTHYSLSIALNSLAYLTALQLQRENINTKELQISTNNELVRVNLYICMFVNLN